MFNIFNQHTLFEEIENKNSWEGTPISSYALLSPAAKGKYGEAFVSQYLKERGHNVQKRENSGHDIILNGVKTEIKFGLATERNYEWGTIFNHIGFDKDWEQIIFACINGDGNFRAALYKKEEIPEGYLHRQQGGKNNNNNDYLINTSKSYSILWEGGQAL